MTNIGRASTPILSHRAVAISSRSKWRHGLKYARNIEIMRQCGRCDRCEHRQPFRCRRAIVYQRLRTAAAADDTRHNNHFSCVHNQFSGSCRSSLERPVSPREQTNRRHKTKNCPLSTIPCASFSWPFFSFRKDSTRVAAIRHFTLPWARNNALVQINFVISDLAAWWMCGQI